MCKRDNFELVPNKVLNDSLNQLRVFCIYSEGGCKWKGELGQLEHHLNKVVHLGKSLQQDRGGVILLLCFRKREILTVY